jgi:hypothetical protein
VTPGFSIRTGIMRAPLFLLSFFFAAAHVAAEPELLPPTGPLAIGRSIHAWRDPSGRDIRVDLFYPAMKPRDAAGQPRIRRRRGRAIRSMQE